MLRLLTGGKKKDTTQKVMEYPTKKVPDDWIKNALYRYATLKTRAEKKAQAEEIQKSNIDWQEIVTIITKNDFQTNDYLLFEYIKGYANEEKEIWIEPLWNLYNGYSFEKIRFYKWMTEYADKWRKNQDYYMWKDSKDKQHKSTSESSNQKDLALDRLKKLLREEDTPKPTFWNGKYSTTLEWKCKIQQFLIDPANKDILSLPLDPDRKVLEIREKLGDYLLEEEADCMPDRAIAEHKASKRHLKLKF